MPLPCQRGLQHPSAIPRYIHSRHRSVILERHPLREAKQWYVQPNNQLPGGRLRQMDSRMAVSR